MSRCLRIQAILVILLPVAKVSAKDGEPQLEELRRLVRAEESLDLAIRLMYDLDFANADPILDRFVGNNPNDPLGPAAPAASALFAILEESHVLQSEFFASDDGYDNRKFEVLHDRVRSRFVTGQNRAERLAKQALDHDPSNPNALFCARPSVWVAGGLCGAD